MKFYCQWDGWRRTLCTHAVCREAEYKKPEPPCVDYPKYVEMKMSGELDG
jgi:hypothetical protein